LSSRWVESIAQTALNLLQVEASVADAQLDARMGQAQLDARVALPLGAALGVCGALLQLFGGPRGVEAS
jgi:hypothetical protein